MNQDSFIEERKHNWNNLDALLLRIKKSGIKSFKGDDIKQLGSLYRKTCSDLSYARSHAYSQELIKYLNQLARRAYGLIYLSDKERKSAVLSFLIWDFPKSIRTNFRFIALAIALFILGTLIGFIINHMDSSFASMVVPPQIQEAWQKQDRPDLDPSFFPQLTSMYWTHNFRVGIYSFVGGILLGLGSLWLLFYNGIIFGVVTSMVVDAHYVEPFFSFVLPHSFVELMAIFICGGAGFIIAWAIISPGDLSRIDSLNLRGKEALNLVLGTIPLFLVAGIIESSFSRLQIHIGFKILFTLATIIITYFYFTYDAEKKKKNTRKYQSYT